MPRIKHIRAFVLILYYVDFHVYVFFEINGLMMMMMMIGQRDAQSFPKSVVL